MEGGCRGVEKRVEGVSYGDLMSDKMAGGNGKEHRGGESAR